MVCYSRDVLLTFTEVNVDLPRTNRVGQIVYRAVNKMSFPNNANKGRNTSSKSFRQIYLITNINNGKLPPRVKRRYNRKTTTYCMHRRSFIRVGLREKEKNVGFVLLSAKHNTK